MNIYKVLPDLKNERQMRLWHQALRAQWSANDIDWDAPQRISSDGLRDSLARLLTPVAMSEQSALYSVSALIPEFGHRSEVEAQFYLTTWAVDEARHTELFARFYGRLGREPMSIRRFPQSYMFQTRIMSKDTAEWLTGILAVEMLAQTLSHEFREVDVDPALSEICDGILRDEARHLGFNHVYLEDHFRKLYAADPVAADIRADQLRKRIKWVIEAVPPMTLALRKELDHIGINMDRVNHTLDKVAHERLDKAIFGGKALAEAAAKKAEVDLVSS